MPKCVWSFPCLQTALGDDESDSGAKYAVEIVKLQHELDRWFQDISSLENGIEMFLTLFDIDVASVPVDVRVEFIELQNDLHLKAKCLSKPLLKFYSECLPRTRFKTCSTFDLLDWKYSPLRTILA